MYHIGHHTFYPSLSVPSDRNCVHKSHLMTTGHRLWCSELQWTEENSLRPWDPVLPNKTRYPGIEMLSHWDSLHEILFPLWYHKWAENFFSNKREVETCMAESHTYFKRILIKMELNWYLNLYVRKISFKHNSFSLYARLARNSLHSRSQSCLNLPMPR